MTEHKPVAWMDDGTTRNGSETTSYRVVTDATKASMPNASAASFTTPLYDASLLSEYESVKRERDEQAAALDAHEIESGVTSNGSLWRFWSQKSVDLATKLSASNARAEAAEAEAKRLREAITAALESLDGAPEYHEQGMGCGLEVRGIVDRYEAMEHGWDKAMERVYSENISWAKDQLTAALEAAR